MGSRRLAHGIFKKALFVPPAGNGSSALFSIGERKGGEEELWHITSATLLPVQVDFLNSCFLAKRHPCFLPLVFPNWLTKTGLISTELLGSIDVLF